MSGSRGTLSDDNYPIDGGSEFPTSSSTSSSSSSSNNDYPSNSSSNDGYPSSSGSNNNGGYPSGGSSLGSGRSVVINNEDNNEGGSSSSNQEESSDSSSSALMTPSLIWIIPPVLSLHELWGPTFMVLIFLGIFIVVLGWLYVYINFNSFQDRITVLSLGNIFNQDPQSRFKAYVQQAAQESISAAMQDITSSNKEVQTSVNRMQQSNLTSLVQPLVEKLTSLMGNRFLQDPNTVSTTQSKK